MKVFTSGIVAESIAIDSNELQDMGIKSKRAKNNRGSQ